MSIKQDKHGHQKLRNSRGDGSAPNAAMTSYNKNEFQEDIAGGGEQNGKEMGAAVSGASQNSSINVIYRQEGDTGQNEF